MALGYAIVEHSHYYDFLYGSLDIAVVQMTYWTYATTYAVYIFNDSPTHTAMGYMATYEGSME